LLQTRQKYAGGLSPGKYFSRRMQQNLPKRHVYTLVKTGSKSPLEAPEQFGTTPALFIGSQKFCAVLKLADTTQKASCRNEKIPERFPRKGCSS
jgi:hypothetical protein